MAAVCTSFGWLDGVSSIHFSTGSRIKIQSPGLHTKHCHLPSQPAHASFLSYLFLTSWDRFAVQSVLLNDRTREDQHLFIPINLSGTVPLSKSQWLGWCKRSRTFYPTKIRDQQKCYWLAEGGRPKWAVCLVELEAMSTSKPAPPSELRSVFSHFLRWVWKRFLLLTNTSSAAVCPVDTLTNKETKRRKAVTLKGLKHHLLVQNHILHVWSDENSTQQEHGQQSMQLEVGHLLSRDTARGRAQVYTWWNTHTQI